MDEVYALEQRVNYFLVDQDHRIRLSSLFQLLQEAAINHANQYHIGTGVMESKGESWILNRVAMDLKRYPRFQETVTVQTWATGLSHFKGFREFRILVGEEKIVQVSTLWLYINLEKKAFTRLPSEVEESFPIRPNDIYYPKLDRLRLPRPGESAKASSVSLRYTDIDANQHVNNAAYMDMLQTALYHQKLGTRPKTVQIQFAKEIPPDASAVEVRLEPSTASTRFSVRCDGENAAFGRLSGKEKGGIKSCLPLKQ